MTYQIAYGGNTATIEEISQTWLLDLPDECSEMDTNDLLDWINNNWMTIPKRLMVAESPLSVSFTPEAIRDHFEGDPYHAEAVEGATDEELTAVGHWCMDSDQLWEMFHSLLVDGLSIKGLLLHAGPEADE